MRDTGCTSSASCDATPESSTKLNDYAAARGYYIEGLRPALGHGFVRHKIYCVAGLAAVAAKLGDTERAAVLWRAVERAEETLSFKMFARERARYDAIMRDLVTAETPVLDIDEAAAIALRA